MATSSYAQLPPPIQAQVRVILDETGLSDDESARERLSALWLEKFKLFNAQCDALGMIDSAGMAKDDPRAAILLSYSGSLVTIGPRRGKERWLEYASIKMRTDVPELLRSDRVNLAADAAVDSVASFEGSQLKRSSSLYRIRLCPEGLSPDEQERRVREATVYLTNGFIKLNKSLSLEGADDVEQFTAKAIVNYVAKKNGVTQVQARAIIDDFLSMVETGLLLGERVSVGKLGSASLRYQAARKARLVRSPKTGEEILVPAKPAAMAPKFSFSQALKEKCSSLDPSQVGQLDEGEED